MRLVDIRIAVGTGFLLLAASAFIETDLSPLSYGGSFVASQLMRGVGTVLAMLFLNQAAIRSVPASQAGRRFRPLQRGAQPGRLAGPGRHRGDPGPAPVAAQPPPGRKPFANSDLVQSGIGAQAHLLGGQDAAIQLGATIQAQALTMTYADLFWMLGVAILCVTPLVLFLRPLPTHAAPVASH
jgi:DHA2 family multidrug resistance protein